jgi:hypothetical protein
MFVERRNRAPLTQCGRMAQGRNTMYTLGLNGPVIPSPASSFGMSDDSFLAYRRAHARYYLARRNTFRKVIASAHQRGLKRDVAITEIDGRALEVWQASWCSRQHWTGEGGFAWDLLSRRYRRKPRSFHAAFWSDGLLCGLAVGWLSRGHEQLTLHFLESAPDARHPLRGDITYLAFTAAELYGRAVGARRLLLRNPLPGISERYKRMGFRLAYKRGAALYLERTFT